ncbi:hypothetical protein [Salinicoccus sp. CNSTN-B1]
MTGFDLDHFLNNLSDGKSQILDGNDEGDEERKSEDTDDAQ